MARVKGVAEHIRMVSLGVTAFSTFSLLLEQVGLGRFIPYIGAAGVGGVLAFAYLYSEAGVWNQVMRDQRDRSTNHCHPGQRINDELIGRGVAAAMRDRPLNETERQAVRDELDAAFREHRDGYNLERIDEPEVGD